MLFKNKNFDKLEMNYNDYIMTQMERMFIIITSAILFFIIGYVFYRKRYIVLILISLFSLYIPKIIKKRKIKKQKEEINIQFKDSLFSLSSSLESGKSIENAIKDVIKDLKIQYLDCDRIIIEYRLILKKINYNKTVYDSFLNFADRSGSIEIKNFAEIFKVTKNTGGDINKIIRRTSRIISNKLEVKRDINLLIESKRYEIRILNIMPILLIIFLSVIASDYMEPVFITLFGFIGTTISIILLILSKVISDKILDIEV